MARTFELIDRDWGTAINQAVAAAQLNDPLEGILPTTAYISAAGKTPARFSGIILEKLGKPVGAPSKRKKPQARCAVP